MTHLSPHFTLEEFVDSQAAARRGLRNTPSPGELENLKRTAETMEKVRTLLNDNPILISSGYRSQAVNAAVGGSKSSAHMSGLAADFICPDFGTPWEICKRLEPHMKELKLDQLIYEFGAWVHLGLSSGAPRHMAMTIDNAGTRHGFGKG